MGLPPHTAEVAIAARHESPRQSRTATVHLGGTVELIVLSVKQKAARCRLLDSGQVMTFRGSRLWEAVPGEIAVVKPNKQWNYAGHPYLCGAIKSTRLDAAALGLVPLRLEDRGPWNPLEHFC
jgi:hypothetical protein